jgi:hypothetical protein
MLLPTPGNDGMFGGGPLGSPFELLRHPRDDERSWADGQLSRAPEALAPKTLSVPAIHDGVIRLRGQSVRQREARWSRREG